MTGALERATTAFWDRAEVCGFRYYRAARLETHSVRDALTRCRQIGGETVFDYQDGEREGFVRLESDDRVGVVVHVWCRYGDRDVSCEVAATTESTCERVTEEVRRLCG